MIDADKLKLWLYCHKDVLVTSMVHIDNQYLKSVWYKKMCYALIGELARQKTVRLVLESKLILIVQIEEFIEELETPIKVEH